MANLRYPAINLVYLILANETFPKNCGVKLTNSTPQLPSFSARSWFHQEAKKKDDQP
jgi:hypothetical protein